MSEPQEIPFTGVRLRYASTASVDVLASALYAAVGSHPVPIDDIARRFEDWDSYEREVQSHVGPSGFMLFATFDHGGWIAKAGIDRQVLRVVIGNPLIAITMLRHDVTAGLFAPVELLLTSEDGGSALTYVRPSSLMVVQKNPPLLAAAQALDAKLAELAESVTG
ncbi:hypothetical protein ASE48_03835 [Mycobacterium sp. Root265]|uniref:DUF302 domain-containing protein n=1 Tax=Mycobacterium sp. Root265 TaxID=1736504 RepID=UPI0007106EDB|nr:DUF302 domain-containing protein [Mycobacterium sp. Root265]KRD14161.1 hypothetical protein ASE48_03835 [Mycobacterium sp. Root265]